jgi:hypothetical protein
LARRPAPTRGIMSGIIGRRPAQGTTWRVWTPGKLTPGKHWFTQSTSGRMRSAPSRLVTSVVSSSSRLTVIEWPFNCASG